MLLSRLRGCIPSKRLRCQVGQMPDMPVSLTRCGRLSARQIPVPRRQVVQSAWRRLGLRKRRLESNLCHCQCCVCSVSFPRQSGIAVRHTAVSPSGFLHQFELLVQFSVDSQSRSSPHPATMTSSPCTTTSTSRDVCPDAHGHLLELSRPMSAPIFQKRCCHPAAARSVPSVHFFSSRHRSVSRRCGGFTYVSVSASASKNARLASNLDLSSFTRR